MNTNTIERTEVKDKIYPSHNENKIKLSERVDAVKLRYIIDHAEEYEPLLVRDDSDEEWTLKRVVDILRKYSKKVKKGIAPILYRQNNKRGRYFGAGLQGLPRAVRHTIAGEFYHDIDIKNAHPVLLAHYCKAKGLEHANLTKYIEKRGDYFSLLHTERGMDRDAAKKVFLKIINGGLRDKIKSYPLDVIDFYNELSTIRKRVMEMEPDLVKLGKKNLKKQKKSENNLDGTVVNLLMCDMENKALIQMFNFFHSQRIYPEVLCFDGLMVRKGEPEDELPEELLRNCEAYVQTETGFNITLAVKEMDEGMDLPEEISNTTYEGVRAKFEENIFKCIIPVGFYNTENGCIHVQTKADLQAAYEHLSYISDDGNEECFIRRWVRDPAMRRYKYVKCLPPPLACPADTYNLWDGFAVEKFEDAPPIEEDVQFVLDHLKRLCNNDEKVYDYVMKWLGFLFQNPGAKNNVALLFKSEEGMGKDMFYSLLKNMIGGNFCGNTIKVERDVLGDFNSFLTDKVLVVINELKGSVGYKYSDDLKFHITSETADIRKMRTDVKANCESFVRYIFFTNNDFPIKVDVGDRRYLVIQTAEPIPDADYFKRLGSLTADRTLMKALYRVWTDIDLSAVDWRNDRPLTEFMLDMRENSREMELSFLIEKVKNWYCMEKEEVTVPSKELLQAFRTECTLQYGFEVNTTPVKFGIKMKKYAIKGFEAQKTRKGTVYTFKIKECVEWLIQKTHLPANYLELPEEEQPRPRLIIRPEEEYTGVTPLFV